VKQRTVGSKQKVWNTERGTESGARVKREWKMVANERRLLRKKLDKEMRFYRLAAREKEPTNGLLRAVRQAMKIPLKEIAAMMAIGESNVFEMEEREETGAIELRSLERMAEAMGCKVVYGVIPANGMTLEELAEGRMWRDVLGSGVSGSAG
jgi:DNA-binding Xre family transcriptional regulator